MSDYLSIGEVAKLKCITVKALRYYEKIGIFIPAYINEETGYRYYKTEQMVVLDFILTCLELGIPLKQFPNYLDINGELNIDLILKDGMNTATQEIERINRTAQKLKNMSDHMEESEEITKNASFFKRFIHQRYL
ncbi:MAG: MerR family DNA-binding transcriptional regulator, partial [Eubacterium sp.]